MTKRVRERVDREKEKKSFKTGLWRLTRTSFLEEEERVLSGNDLHFFYRKMDDDAMNEQTNERTTSFDTIFERLQTYKIGCKIFLKRAILGALFSLFLSFQTQVLWCWRQPLLCKILTKGTILSLFYLISSFVSS